jgi:hypothetical protein
VHDYLLFNIEQLSARCATLGLWSEKRRVQACFIHQWADQIDSTSTIVQVFKIPIDFFEQLNTQPVLPSLRPHYLSQHMPVPNG